MTTRTRLARWVVAVSPSVVFHEMLSDVDDLRRFGAWMIAAASLSALPRSTEAAQ